MEKKMKNMIDNLKNNRPQLKNPEQLKETIIDRIEAKERSQKRITFLHFVKWAAAIIILIGIGNFSYQEYYTRTAALSLQVHQKRFEPVIESSMTCTDAIQEMISKLRHSSFNRINEQRYYLFSLADVAYLKEIESPYYTDVKAFVEVLQKYYPNEYELLMERGETNLSVKKLSNDYRICKLLRK